MTNEQRERLTAIMAAANKAVLSAHRMRRKIEGAINWGDLSCSDVELVESLMSSEYGENSAITIRVVIEEADPENRQLQEYIAQKLSKAGFLDIEVWTEW